MGIDPNDINVDWGKLTTVSDNSSYICRISINCLICGEQIDLNEYEEKYAETGKPLIKVCNKCKAAIINNRNNMGNKSMKIINATTIGNLISAHYEGNNEKFNAYVRFIIESYEEQGEQRKADIIRKRADGSYKNSPIVVLDNIE